MDKAQGVVTPFVKELGDGWDDSATRCSPSPSPCKIEFCSSDEEEEGGILKLVYVENGHSSGSGEPSARFMKKISKNVHRRLRRKKKRPYIRVPEVSSIEDGQNTWTRTVGMLNELVSGWDHTYEAQKDWTVRWRRQRFLMCESGIMTRQFRRQCRHRGDRVVICDYDTVEMERVIDIDMFYLANGVSHTYDVIELPNYAEQVLKKIFKNISGI